MSKTKKEAYEAGCRLRHATLASALQMAAEWDDLFAEVRRLKAVETEFKTQIASLAKTLGVEPAIGWPGLLDKVREDGKRAWEEGHNNATQNAVQYRAALSDVAAELDMEDDDHGDAQDVLRRISKNVSRLRCAVASAKDDSEAERELGWEFAMRHIAQQMGLPEDGAVNVVEGRIVAEVARLREGIMRVTLERDSLAYRSAAKGSDVPEQEFDVSQAMALARVGDMLGLDRESNDDDEALVRAEIARLLKVATDAEKNVAPDEVAKARAEGERAGYAKAQDRLAAYIERRRARLDHASSVTKAARKAAAQADAEERRAAAEVAGLDDAADALNPEEIPF